MPVADRIPFNFLDAAVVVLLALGLISGLRRKLSGEFAGLLVASATLLAGVRIYGAVAGMLTAHTRLSGHPDTAGAVAFLLVIVMAWSVFFMLSMVLGLVMKIVFNEKIDRAAGAVAGMLRTAVMATACIVAAGLWPNPFLRGVIREDSFSGRLIFNNLPAVVEKAGNLLKPVLPENGDDRRRAGNKPD